MTSEFEKWVELYVRRDPNYAASCGYPEERAQFWIKAAFAEIERRAKQQEARPGWYREYLGRALEEMRQEWFG